MTDRRYIVEKLTNVLEALATGPGDARSRLANAFSACHLEQEDFPSEHRKTWAGIKRDVTKFGPLTDTNGKMWRGSIENTLGGMRNTTASDIAKRLFDLY